MEEALDLQGRPGTPKMKDCELQKNIWILLLPNHVHKTTKILGEEAGRAPHNDKVIMIRSSR